MAEKTFGELLDETHVVRAGSPEAEPAPGGPPRVVVDEDHRLIGVLGHNGPEDPILVDADAPLDAWFAGDDFAVLDDEQRCGVVVMRDDTVLGLVPRAVLEGVAAVGLTDGIRGELSFDGRLAGPEKAWAFATVVCGCGFPNELYDALPPYGRCGNPAVHAHDIEPVEEP